MVTCIEKRGELANVRCEAKALLTGKAIMCKNILTGGDDKNRKTH